MRISGSLTPCPNEARRDPTEAPLFRILIEPSERNGLRTESRLMADKITAVPKTRIGRRIGRLDDEDVIRLNRAVVIRGTGSAGSWSLLTRQCPLECGQDRLDVFGSYPPDNVGSSAFRLRRLSLPLALRLARTCSGTPLIVMVFGGMTAI